MNKLKIGVLTFHRCINYGSYWQASSLVEGLRAKGHNAVLLDYDSPRANLAEWKCAYRPVLPTAVPESDYPLYRKKIQAFFQAFAGLPLSKRFPLSDPEQMDSYDVVVVGSDEVWNLFHPWYGKCSLFYGDGLKAQRLISYAASFGNYPASLGISTDWADRLRQFDAISVRDKNSYSMLKNALDLEPEMVLDPCLQFAVEPEPRVHSHLQQSYIAVYGHNFSASFIQKIRPWANKKRLPLISIGYRNDWADEQWITADPHDFAHFMKQAAAVVTNFFHGCVFALKNEKPFVCETTQYRSFKVEGLMEKIGGEQHLITEEVPETVVHHLLQHPIDSNILQRIDELRQRSTEYLNDAMGRKQLLCA